ncbi:hypothetical protein QIH93_20930 [Bradyrhizobium ottawaense]|uniref:hypothetical protein n=1 Tax=Bradyrhizobium ottawaense TaxID=931866 RepID=UPI002714E16E|nr:hypothetical protein [Bradyrhizobium ottawaense]WLB43014.1 hypothetical protein QIH93_20930 [Bradyrhizobium ottawaense]
MAIDFPRALLREKSHAWNLAGVTVAGGQTGASVATLVRSDGGGYWTCSMSDVSLSGGRGLVGKERQKISTLLWRAVRQVCEGGVTSIVVPRNDALFRPWPEGLPQGESIVPHSDSSLFSDGAGYYQPVIDIACAAAELRATSLEIEIVEAGELVGGEAFSIEHETAGWRLYEIKTVDARDDGQATITFNPPLREAVSDGTRLEFDRPRCLMRLAQTSSMNLTVQPWTFTSASVDFVEAPLT